jgi:hypothetical protein
VPGEPISFEQLAHSASTSAEATSGRFAFDMSLTFPGAEEEFAFSGEGAFDAASERASFAVDMSSFAKLLGGFVAGLGGANADELPDFDDPTAWKIQVVQDGEVGYVRFPAIDDQLPDGKTWVKGSADGVKAGGFDFQELESFTRSDPRDVLEALRGVSGEIETVGAEELRGVETTHYRALVDPMRVAKDATAGTGGALFDQFTSSSDVPKTIPFDVWIDSGGLVRKLSIDLSAQGSASTEGQASLAFELWDYGERVEIELPPASQVADESEVRG